MGSFPVFDEHDTKVPHRKINEDNTPSKEMLIFFIILVFYLLLFFSFSDYKSRQIEKSNTDTKKIFEQKAGLAQVDMPSAPAIHSSLDERSAIYGIVTVPFLVIINIIPALLTIVGTLPYNLGLLFASSSPIITASFINLLDSLVLPTYFL